MSLPKTVNPAAIRHLPPPVRQAFENAFAAALHPVFIVAAAVSVLAFALAWLAATRCRSARRRRPDDAIPPPRNEDAAREAAA